ncbi:GRP family sugar transporter [Streptomyces silvensis]|uniref:Multidrug DMT transporter permease n=1 Tax=Streptomyces silvensis TaxID=1765722 RepID=A0A0W7X978_9ACTN|nr:GRP family sugar transporter [Streptomyces silvensis]KUF19170.1 multidrug DMT transporter permease [Streptomyces silvensis]
MGVLFALVSALCYGISDFVGGLLSRRGNFLVIAFIGQVGGLLLAVAAVFFMSSAPLNATDAAWGALSGVGTGMGMLFLFRGMSRGAMSVVMPVSALTGIALPVVAGVLLLGDRPSPLAWLGIAVSLPALWLVARGDSSAQERPGRRAFLAPASADALLAGGGIALQYLALAQAGATASVWPVATGRVAAIVVLVPVLLLSSAGFAASPRNAAGAALTGMTAALALLFYMLALRQQMVTVTVVLSSFYPAIPVVLGIAVLRERLTTLQAWGVVAAGVAVGLLAFS